LQQQPDSQKVNKAEILKQMDPMLLNISLPKQFLVVDELPMMSIGKIDFRNVAWIVKERLGG